MMRYPYARTRVGEVRAYDSPTNPNQGSNMSSTCPPFPTPAQQWAAEQCGMPASSCRRWPIGFLFQNVAAGAISTITVVAQRAGWPDRLTFDSTEAANFNVQEIKVGSRSQEMTSTTGEYPASGLSEVAVDSRLILDPVDTGTNVSIRVRNKSAAVSNLTGMLFCWTTGQT
jgi:hypothetical protein